MDLVPTEHILHIAEFATTLAIVYVGLDRVGERETKVRQLARAIQDINETVLERWQPVVNGRLKILYDSDDLYKMAHVTRRWLPEPEKARRKRVIKWARKHCPLLHFFIDRKDLTIAYVLCALTTSSFFMMSLLATCEIGAPLWMILVLHLYYVFSSIWLLYTVYASFKIYSLLPEMETVKKCIEARQEQITEENLEASVQSKELETKSFLLGRPKSLRVTSFPVNPPARHQCAECRWPAPRDKYFLADAPKPMHPKDAACISQALQHLNPTLPRL